MKLIILPTESPLITGNLKFDYWSHDYSKRVHNCSFILELTNGHCTVWKYEEEKYCTWEDVLKIRDEV